MSQDEIYRRLSLLEDRVNNLEGGDPPRPRCVVCGHECPQSKWDSQAGVMTPRLACGTCGGDPMLIGDLLCVPCDRRARIAVDGEKDDRQTEKEVGDPTLVACPPICKKCGHIIRHILELLQSDLDQAAKQEVSLKGGLKKAIATVVTYRKVRGLGE